MVRLHYSAARTLPIRLKLHPARFLLHHRLHRSVTRCTPPCKAGQSLTPITGLSFYAHPSHNRAYGEAGKAKHHSIIMLMVRSSKRFLTAVRRIRCLHHSTTCHGGSVRHSSSAAIRIIQWFFFSLKTRPSARIISDIVRHIALAFVNIH